jgi:hypothetical protein
MGVAGVGVKERQGATFPPLLPGLASPFRFDDTKGETRKPDKPVEFSVFSRKRQYFGIGIAIITSCELDYVREIRPESDRGRECSDLLCCAVRCRTQEQW